MAQRDLTPVVAALLAALERALRQLASIRRSNARNEERADELEQDLKAILQACGSVAGQGAFPSTIHLTRGLSRQRQVELEAAAQHGITQLEFVALPNGRASVGINGGPIFSLSRTLAALFKILAQDPGRQPGELVDWKSQSEVIAEMESELGTPLKVHTIQSQVTRLRNALEYQGATNPYFVQSSPEAGWRLALRRKLGL